MGDLDSYIKDIESENERLRSEIYKVIVEKEREDRRKIFVWTREILDAHGLAISTDYTLSTDESRKWIYEMPLYMHERTGHHVSIACWANSKNRNAIMRSVLTWSCHWERQSLRSHWKLTQSSRYSGNGSRSPVKDKQLQLLVIGVL